MLRRLSRLPGHAARARAWSARLGRKDKGDGDGGVCGDFGGDGGRGGRVRRAWRVGTAGGRMAAHRRRLSACPRSEEHTSELQSLMRISYAVFCLKQKKLP